MIFKQKFQEAIVHLKIAFINIALILLSLIEIGKAPMWEIWIVSGSRLHESLMFLKEHGWRGRWSCYVVEERARGGPDGHTPGTRAPPTFSRPRGLRSNRERRHVDSEQATDPKKKDRPTELVPLTHTHTHTHIYTNSHLSPPT